MGMTNEEMERAIEVLLAQQATLDGQIAQTNAQVAETARLLGLHAETQTQFIEITNQNFDRVTTALERLIGRVDKLTAAFEQHIADGHGGPG